VKTPRPSPLLEAAMQPRTAADFDACFHWQPVRKDLEDAIEDDPKGDDRTPFGVRPLFYAKKWFDLLPQIVGNMPYCFESASASHCFVPSKRNIQVQ
jgi:hypothetical protein